MSGKAASVIRRGGVRIRSLGSGHAPLNLVISELSTVRQTLKDSIAAQERASEAQKRWGEDDDIPALRDVLTQLAEVQGMWIEAQREYLASLKEFKRTYESILVSEKKLDTARKQLATYEDKEKKYDKELSKGSKDPENAKRKLKMYTDAKSLAESEVYGQEKETVAVKFMCLKSGLLDHSRAWATLGRVCCQFAECQKNLASLIPDVSPQTDAPPTYTNSRRSKEILRDLKAALANGVPPSYDQSSIARSLSQKIPSPPPYDPPVLRPPQASQYRKQKASVEDENDSFDDSFDEN